MKGRIRTQRGLALALAGLLFLLPAPAPASASVKVSAQAEQSSVQAGDIVEVVITVRGESMAVAEGVFTYDSAVLTYDESEGGASDGFLNMVSAEKGGADVLSARIRFTAAAAGETEIVFSVEKILKYDGAEEGGAKTSVSVAVSAPAATPAPTPLNYAEEGVLAQSVKGASENLYIWRSLENVTVPSRYSETTLQYHGETVAAARVADSDAPTLLYLSNAAGDAGGYYIYDEEADALNLYRTLSSISKSYILLEPDGSVALPDSFEQTVLLIGEREYPAWKSADAQGGMFLVYARNPDGETGYYVYSAEDESLQRYAVMPARPVQIDTPSGEGADLPLPTAGMMPDTPSSEQSGGITLEKPLFYALCAVGVLLLIVTVALFAARLAEWVRRRRRAAQRRERRNQDE